MTLQGADLCYNVQMLDATDATTIIGFARVFYKSLHGAKQPESWLASMRAGLRTNAGSRLFSGYGWEMKYDGKMFEKN